MEDHCPEKGAQEVVRLVATGQQVTCGVLEDHNCAREWRAIKERLGGEAATDYDRRWLLKTKVGLESQ